VAVAPCGNPPLTNREAWQIYQTFAADDRLGLVDQEPAGIAASPKLWMDAYLAAFARSAGHTLVTTDAAFTQFADLDLRLLTA